jgi:four helix bundle protein
VQENAASPFNLNEWLQASTWQRITETAEYQLATELINRIDAAYIFFCERPKYSAIHDQLLRNSSSILLNFCEGMGKSRGFVLSACLIARGEAMECLATASILPKQFRDDWTPLLLKIVAALDARISRLPTK